MKFFNSWILAVALLVAAPLVAAPLAAQSRDSAEREHKPPPGMCRIWLNDVPANRQPEPTDCPTAIRKRPPNGRVIFGDELRRNVRDKPTELPEGVKQLRGRENEREPETKKRTLSGSQPTGSGCGGRRCCLRRPSRHACFRVRLPAGAAFAQISGTAINRGPDFAFTP